MACRSTGGLVAGMARLFCARCLRLRSCRLSADMFVEELEQRSLQPLEILAMNDRMAFVFEFDPLVALVVALERRDHLLAVLDRHARVAIAMRDQDRHLDARH